MVGTEQQVPIQTGRLFGMGFSNLDPAVATNGDVEPPGVAIYRFEGDKLAESWVQADFLRLFQQLGITPEMPGGA